MKTKINTLLGAGACLPSSWPHSRTVQTANHIGRWLLAQTVAAALVGQGHDAWTTRNVAVPNKRSTSSRDRCHRWMKRVTGAFLPFSLLVVAAHGSILSDPVPTVTTTAAGVVLSKELHGYANYGAVDNASDILYTGEQGTWNFTIPGSVDLTEVSSAFFRVFMVVDDHYSTSPSLYTYSVTIDSSLAASGQTGLPHGDLFGSLFSNWQIRDYGVPLFGGASHTITLNNTSATASGDWIAVDRIELHLFVNPNRPPTITCPAPSTYPCDAPNGATLAVSVGVSDADNDPVIVTWTVDGTPVATHSLSAGATSDSLNHLFGFGTHTVSASATDGKSDPVTCSTTVTVTAHDEPVPSLVSLPTIEGQCSASITETPTAIDVCADGGIVSGTTTDPLSYTVQGTYTVTWTYTDPHDPTLFTTQPQTVIVKDTTPPTITCPPSVTVAYGSEPAVATDAAEFLAQGGTISDNCDANGTVTSHDVANGNCPTVITRTYVVTDAAGNAAGCEQTITVNNLFAEDGMIWHQPLARNGASEDTDPSAGRTVKYRFKRGSTIPIQIHALGCDGGDVTSNANVIGQVTVFGDSNCEGAADGNVEPIEFNGVGGAGGVMVKIDGHLKYNLDTKSLPTTTQCYILRVTVTDTSTGEERFEEVLLQAK